jgi:hypothetical protein
LLIDGLNLHKFVLILKVKQERIGHKVKILAFCDVDFELFNRLKEIRQKFTVELPNWYSWFVFVTLVQ